MRGYFNGEFFIRPKRGPDSADSRSLMRTALYIKFPVLYFPWGISSIWALIGCPTARNCSEHRYFSSEFLKIRNMELFSKSREASRKIRESDRRIRVAP